MTYERKVTESEHKIVQLTRDWEWHIEQRAKAWSAAWRRPDNTPINWKERSEHTQYAYAHGKLANDYHATRIRYVWDFPTIPETDSELFNKHIEWVKRRHDPVYLKTISRVDDMDRECYTCRYAMDKTPVRVPGRSHFRTRIHMHQTFDPFTRLNWLHYRPLAVTPVTLGELYFFAKYVNLKSQIGRLGSRSAHITLIKKLRKQDYIGEFNVSILGDAADRKVYSGYESAIWTTNFVGDNSDDQLPLT